MLLRFSLPVRDVGAFRHRYLVSLPGGDGLRAHKGSRAIQMDGRGGQSVHRAVHGIRFMREVCQQYVVVESDRNKPEFLQGLGESIFRVGENGREADWISSDDRNWRRVQHVEDEKTAAVRWRAARRRRRVSIAAPTPCSSRRRTCGGAFQKSSDTTPLLFPAHHRDGGDAGDGEQEHHGEAEGQAREAADLEA